MWEPHTKLELSDSLFLEQRPNSTIVQRMSDRKASARGVNDDGPYMPNAAVLEEVCCAKSKQLLCAAVSNDKMRLFHIWITKKEGA
jgi:hypothetical protein